MIDSEISALERRIREDGGLTLESAVKASEIYARAGNTTPLLFFNQYKPLDTFSDKDRKQIAENIKLGNVRLAERRAELDLLVGVGNSAYAQYTPRFWAKTDGYFVVPCMRADGSRYVRELKNELLGSQSQVAHLDHAYGADPSEFIIQPASTTMDAMVAVDHDLRDASLPSDQRVIVEEVKEYVGSSHRQWPHTATRGRYRAQGTSQFVDFPATSTHRTLESVQHPLVVASAVDVPQLVGPDGRFTSLEDGEAIAQALFGRTAVQVEQVGESVTGHRTGLFRLNNTISQDTERAVLFDDSIGSFDVYVCDYVDGVGSVLPALGWRERSEP